MGFVAVTNTPSKTARRHGLARQTETLCAVGIVEVKNTIPKLALKHGAAMQSERGIQKPWRMILSKTKKTTSRWRESEGFETNQIL